MCVCDVHMYDAQAINESYVCGCVVCHKGSNLIYTHTDGNTWLRSVADIYLYLYICLCGRVYTWLRSVADIGLKGGRPDESPPPQIFLVGSLSGGAFRAATGLDSPALSRDPSRETGEEVCGVIVMVAA